MPQANTAQFVVRTTAAIAAGLALLVFVGWGFGIDAIKGVLPGLSTMKANTALGFLLAGGSLWLAVSDRMDFAARFARRWAHVAVAALGAVTLSEYVLHVDLGIDQLLFPDADRSGLSAAGRMSVITAANSSHSGRQWRSRQGAHVQPTPFL